MEEHSQNLNELLKLENNYRESVDKTELFSIFQKIVNEISTLNNDDKYDIISKIFLYPNQSNYSRFYLMYCLFQHKNFISNNLIKKNYYQLLIDSFKSGKTKDLIDETKSITKIYEKSDINNLENLDKFIVELICKLSEKSSPKISKTININKIDTSGKNLINERLDTFETNDFHNKNSSSRHLEVNNDFHQSTTQTYFSEFSNNKNDLSMTSQKILNSHSTTNAIEMKNLMKKYKPNIQLPMIIFSASTTMNKEQFLHLMKSTFHKLNYKLICNIKESDYDNCHIFEYKPKNCFENLKCRFVKNQFQVLTILKSNENNFSMGVNTFLHDFYERKISIKTIKGKEQNVIQFLIKFLNNFCLSINKIKIIKQSKCLMKYNLEVTLRQIIKDKKNSLCKNLNLPNNLPYSNKNENYQVLMNEETYVEKTNNQANKVYEIYKILSKNEYDLGKYLSDFITDFKSKYRNIPVMKLDTKTIMIQIVKVLEFCTNTLNSSFNNNPNNDIEFYSVVCEQFLFNKIYYILFNIYNQIYSKENEEFKQNQNDINNKLTKQEILLKLEVKNKFKGEENFPFRTVVEKINQINFEKCLKKKFAILAQSSLEIRNCILEYTNGKYELDSMDDELPIVIYIATQINVDNLFAELNMLDDYIKSTLRDTLIQNKMVTNLLSSLMFINTKWNSDTATFDCS